MQPVYTVWRSYFNKNLERTWRSTNPRIEQPFNIMLPNTVFLRLFETRMKCVLMALKVTLHWSAHWDNVCRSMLICCMVVTGSSTTASRVVSMAYWCVCRCRLHPVHISMYLLYLHAYDYNLMKLTSSTNDK